MPRSEKARWHATFNITAKEETCVMKPALQRKLQQIDLLGDCLEAIERGGDLPSHFYPMCEKLFEQLEYDPLPIERWGLIWRCYMGYPLTYIPEPIEVVILDDCAEKYGEFVRDHAKALDEGKMTFEQSVEWSERSLAWARFWNVRHPDPMRRAEYAVMVCSIEDELAFCIARVRKIWRKQGLYPRMINDKLVLVPIKQGGE
jgi:hypothetical protein